MLENLQILLIAILIAIVSSSAQSKERPLHLDDVMRTESFGPATFDHSGRWLAYTRVPPYEDLEDYSIALFSFMGMGGRQVWVVDTESNDAAFQLSDEGLDTTSFLQDFSPDGKSLVLVRYKHGMWEFQSCAIEYRRCTVFPKMPDVLDGYIRIDPNSNNLFQSAKAARLVWTSDKTFVFPMRDHNVPNSEMRNRAAIGRMLWEKWNDSWRGEESTASLMVSSGRDVTNEWDAGELLEMNVSTGQWRVLANGRYAGITPSPDGRLLATARLGVRERPLSDAAYSPAGPDVLTVTHPLFDRRSAPYILDSSTGRVLPILDPFNVDPTSFAWSDDGRLIAVYGWRRGESPHRGKYHVIDVETGKTIDVAEGVEFANRNNDLSREILSVSGPSRALFVGNRLVVFARPMGASRYDWYLFHDGRYLNLSENIRAPSHIPIFSSSEGAVISSSDGIYRIAPGMPATQLDFVEFDTDKLSYRDLQYPVDARRPFEEKSSLLRSSPGAGENIVFLDLSDASSNTKPRVTKIAENRSVVAASYSSGRVLYQERDGSASALVLINSDGKVRELAKINQHIDDLPEVRVERISYSIYDELGKLPPRTSEACLLLPFDYEAGRRYPIVVDVYPSLAGVSSCRTFHAEPVVRSMINDLWASRGVIYMRPPVPLNYARGRNGPISGIVPVVTHAVDAAIEAGFVDPEYVFLSGVSQGGVASLYVAAKSNRFKGVMSMFGWADFYAHYFEGRGLYRYFHLDQNGGDNRWRYECIEPGERNFCPYGFGLNPLENAVPYVSESPVAMARDISVPVLLAHSDLDYFGMNQYDMMFGSLFRAGKDVRYVRYFGEGHTPSSPANIRDLWRRIDHFLHENGVTPSTRVVH